MRTSAWLALQLQDGAPRALGYSRREAEPWLEELLRGASPRAGTKARLLLSCAPLPDPADAFPRLLHCVSDCSLGASAGGFLHLVHGSPGQHSSAQHSQAAEPPPGTGGRAGRTAVPGLETSFHSLRCL